MTPKAPRVLLVDDEPRNLRRLEGTLGPLGYDLRSMSEIGAALRLAANTPPDLVLLDVMTAESSSIEVCRQLKSDRRTQFIPVVLVTSLSDSPSRVAGLEAGADGFVNRPVDSRELRARIEALLRTKALYDELERRYQDLQRLEASRKSMAEMIVHDLRNPLVSVIGYLELIERGYAEGEAGKRLGVVKKNAERLVAMVTDILDVSKLEANRMPLERSAVDLGALFADVALDMNPIFEQKQIGLEVAIPLDLPAANADCELIRRVPMNLLSNAAAFSPRGSVVSFSAEVEAGRVRVQVSDSGPGVAPEDRYRIFDKFGSLEDRRGRRKYSTGLGLTFCKLTVEAHGGEIGIDRNQGPGSTFWFTLEPVAEPSGCKTNTVPDAA